MGEIKCKDGNTYYTAPGSAITSIPIFGGTSASFTGNSPSMGAIKSSIYTYTDKIVKGSNSSYYITGISAPLIKNLYKSKTVCIDGVNTQLYYRRYTRIFYGAVTGWGGNTGSSGKYMADERTGGGGGGAGACVFIFSVASDSEVTRSDIDNTGSDGSYSMAFTCDGYTIRFTGLAGSNGTSGGSSCGASVGSGGSAGTASIQLGSTAYGVPANVNKQYGPFYVVGVARAGTAGAGGGTWGDRGDATDASFSFNSTLLDALGTSASIGWSRADGQNGSSIMPGIEGSSGTLWAGSGGGQTSWGAHWVKTYSL